MKDRMEEVEGKHKPHTPLPWQAGSADIERQGATQLGCVSAVWFLFSFGEQTLDQSDYTACVQSKPQQQQQQQQQHCCSPVLTLRL